MKKKTKESGENAYWIMKLFKACRFASRMTTYQRNKDIITTRKKIERTSSVFQEREQKGSRSAQAPKKSQDSTFLSHSISKYLFKRGPIKSSKTPTSDLQPVLKDYISRKCTNFYTNSVSSSRQKSSFFTDPVYQQTKRQLSEKERTHKIKNW